MLDIPCLRQAFDYDCGAVVLQAVLAYYGIEIREDKLIKMAGTSKKKGTNPAAMVKVLKKYGLEIEEGEMTMNEIKNFLKNKVPVIIFIQAWINKKSIDWVNNWGDGHYVIVIGYDEKKIYFEDPGAFKRTYLNWEELEMRWHDQDFDGKKYHNYGIAAYGKKPVYCSNQLIHLD